MLKSGLFRSVLAVLTPKNLLDQSKDPKNIRLLLFQKPQLCIQKIQ